MRRADVILPYVQGCVTRHAWAAWRKPRVRAAGLGKDAARLGAVPLISEEL